MKRILSTAAFIILIVAIAAVAVYALNGQPAAETAAAPAAVPGSASVESNALAPEVGPRYNGIALPLAVDGLDHATDLVAYIATNTSATATKVLEWDPNIGSSGAAVGYDASDLFPNDIPLATGGAYLVFLQGASSDVLSFVGDVPGQGTISFSLIGGSPSQCRYNLISLPLDQDQITKATEFVSEVGDVIKVLEWDPTIGDSGAAVGYDLNDLFPNDISMRIGYPYLVCMTASKTWP